MGQKDFKYKRWSFPLGRIKLTLILLLGVAQLPAAPANGKGEKVAPYPRIRSYTSPSQGEEARFNSPSLQWPTKKRSTYSVRISTSKTFDKNILEQSGIPYAIYNPHRKLAPGTWFWQYKCNKDAWGKCDSFTIKSTTPLFDTSDLKSLLANIPATHPRVLITKEELPKLRNAAKGNKERADILKEAEDLTSKPLLRESEAFPTFKGKDAFENEKIASIASKRAGWYVQRLLVTLSQAYLLTGDIKYFETARKWMLSVSDWDPNGPSHTNNFGDAGIMVGLAIGVDSFWDLLTATERAKIIGQSTTRGNQFYQLWINQVESRSSSMHVWQHLLHNLIETSLAFHGIVPESDQWLEYGYELWIAQSPKMGEKDGAWFNGTSYFGMNTLSLIDIPAIFGRLSGQSFMQSDWYPNNPLWLIYAFPPQSVSDGFCNDGERYARPIINYAGYADAMARLFNLPYASWYAQSVARSLGGEVADDEEFRWFRIRTGLEKQLPAPLEQFQLPQAACFPDIGVAYMHTTLQKTATDLMLSVRSSPFGPMSHAHADQNCFNIAYGGKKLFYNSGYRPAMGDPHFLGWYKHTRGHNGLLIDDHGQPFSDESYGYIPRFLHGHEISYAVGDASKAYAGTDENGYADYGMKRFRRHFLMLRPATIVIYDDLEADHPAAWSWLLHNDSGLEIDTVNHAIRAGNESTRALVSLFASTPLHFRVTDQFSVPVDNWTKKTDEEGDTIDFRNQFHFMGVSKEKKVQMRYLAIIQIKPDGQFESISTGGEIHHFQMGDWWIEAEMDGSKPALLKARKADNSVSLVSSGDLSVSTKTFSGKSRESSKLFEIVGGKAAFQEATDELPASLRRMHSIEENKYPGK